MLPLYLMLYYRAKTPIQYIEAGAVLAVSCLTDFFDGRIARKYNMVSTTGKILDPIADKITQILLTLQLSRHFPSLKTVVFLLIVKEMFQLAVGLWFLLNGKILSGAILPGKISTTVLFCSLIMLVFFPNTPISIVRLITFSDAVILCFATVSYFFAYFGRNCKVKSIHSSE